MSQPGNPYSDSAQLAQGASNDVGPAFSGIHIAGN
jgi:hypothetical protein